MLTVLCSLVEDDERKEFHELSNVTEFNSLKNEKLFRTATECRVHYCSLIASVYLWNEIRTDCLNVFVVNYALKKLRVEWNSRKTVDFSGIMWPS